MNPRRKIIEVAQSQINYREGSNNATKYGAWYGMDNQPWCAMFISWCAAQAGIPEKIIPKQAYVPYMVDWFKKQKRYRDKKLYWPSPGDIIFFGNASHVGLVESVSGNAIVTIEGNTSRAGNSSNGDGVYRRYRDVADSWIMGYACPDYKEEKMEPIKLTIDLCTENGIPQEEVTVATVNIDGENYIRLRDLPELLDGITVDWDEDRERPVVLFPVAEPEADSGLPDKQAVQAALALLAKACGV